MFAQLCGIRPLEQCRRARAAGAAGSGRRVLRPECATMLLNVKVTLAWGHIDQCFTVKPHTAAPPRPCPDMISSFAKFIDLCTCDNICSSRCPCGVVCGRGGLPDHQQHEHLRPHARGRMGGLPRVVGQPASCLEKCHPSHTSDECDARIHVGIPTAHGHW
jgi:hypothetical protein